MTMRTRIAFIAVALLTTLAHAAAPLATDGKSDYVIVLAPSPMPANARAAAEMQKFVKAISGADLPIVNDSQPLSPHAILIGPSKHLDQLGVTLDTAKLGTDGFVLKTLGDRLVMAGPGPRGSMYGTYEVLERLGVRWFTPKVTRVPKQSNLELPTLDEAQVPAFEYREPYWTEAWNKDWAARNKLIGHSLPLDDSTGGNIRYGDFVHSFDRLIPPELFGTHPEYFPLIGGKRTNGYVQRCLTNPDVLNLTIEGVRKVFKENPNAVITTISQNDVDKWCECENCAKLTKQYGAHSGLYLWFVNEVAEAIEKDLPDKLIDTLAYQFTETPPTGIVPRANVRIRLCPIANCQAHPYEHCEFPATKAMVANLAAWAKITDKLYIWHYTTDFAGYLMPFPDFNEFPADTRLYQRSGVKGIFFQGAYSGGGGGSDAELRSWVMSRILWDPSRDADARVTEWMKGVYGKAWEPMRKWFDLLHEQTKDPTKHMFCYTLPRKVPYFTDEVLTKGDALFDEAEKLASGDATATEYVARGRICLRFIKLCRHPTDGPELTGFIADAKKLGINAATEQKNLDQWRDELVANLKK